MTRPEIIRAGMYPTLLLPSHFPCPTDPSGHDSAPLTELLLCPALRLFGCYCLWLCQRPCSWCLGTPRSPAPSLGSGSAQTIHATPQKRIPPIPADSLPRFLLDSIDLQDHGAPSAQNHQARPSPLQTNHSAAHVAPHQAETLREVAAETAEEELRSPRVSWNQGAEAGELQKYAEDLAAGVTSSLGSSDDNTNMSAAHAQQDDLAVAQNGGLVSQDNQDDGDVDADEGDLDDDMMDKISSSPSIDDGGSACQLSSFVRFAKPDAASCSSPASAYCREARSPSPYLDLPNYLPLQRKPTYYQLRPTSRLHHLLGGSSEDLDQTDADPATRADAGHLAGGDGPDEVYESQSDGQPAYGDTVPANGCDLSGAECEREDVLGEQPEQEDEAIEDMEDNFDCSDDLIVPYEDFTDEDDDDSFLLYNDSRFVDSGWGGECLQDTEDIDFELVYALHTFIATVEGQANATKGDAMVLLDDSNSYWWLVRVVKDSSIGKNMLNLWVGGIQRMTDSIVGYLPAEHIETPTERLARLNKHRNIDVRQPHARVI